MARELEAIDLTVGQRQAIAVFLKRYLPDTNVWAYGSRVKFTAKPSSDLDMVAFATPAQSPAITNLQAAFEESSLPFRVDLFIWDEVPERFRKNIQAAHFVLQAKAQDLPAGWEEVQLGEIAKVSTGKTNRQDACIDGAYPLFDRSTVIKQSAKYLFDCEAVIVAGEGSEFIPRYYSGKFDLHQRSYRITACNKSNVSTRFLYYYLLSHRAYWARVAVGSTVKSLRMNSFTEFPINLPPLPEQRAIADILGSLDDKIELNRRMNETLAAMAQALFKSWFVDFDPVIDNALAAGNPIPDEFAKRAAQRKNAAPRDSNTHNAQIRALFPPAFEHTKALGWIPKGWRVGMLNSFGDIICGKTPSKKKKEYYGGDIPFIKIPDMHDNVYSTNYTEYLSTEGALSQKKKQIPAGAICVSCIATVGKVLLTHRDSHTNQQINSIVPNDSFAIFYLYFQMLEKNKLLHDLASGGSTTLNLNTGHFSKIEILKPADNILKIFNSFSSHLFSKILNNCYENDSLSNIRDTLLPKLLSGEVRIPEAKKRVGGCNE